MVAYFGVDTQSQWGERDQIERMEGESPDDVSNMYLHSKTPKYQLLKFLHYCPYKYLILW